MSQAPRDTVRRLAESAFLLFVATLPWTIAPMSVALGLCGALTLWAWLRYRDVRPPAPWIGPALGWMAALTIAAWFAEDRQASLARLGKGLLPLIVVVSAYHARDAGSARRALAVLMGSAVIAAVLGLGLWMARGAAYPERAHGPVGHYMTFAGQILLWLPVACSTALVVRDPRWRAGALLAAAVGAAALAATFTRSAWIGFFVALVIVVASTRPRWLAGLALAGAVAIVLAPASYRARLASAFDPSHATNVERRHMWSGGLRMFLDHPVTGVGLQDLHTAYERYRPAGAREPAGHLHNVFIQIAASMGAIGIVAFAWLYATLLRMSARGLWRPRSPGGLGHALRLGVTASLVGFLVAGTFEWNFGDEELLDLLYTMVGLAWASGVREDRNA